MKNSYEERERESSSTKSNQTNKEFIWRREREREREREKTKSNRINEEFVWGREREN